MTRSAHDAEHPPALHSPIPVEHAHPSPGKYVQIALILAFVTFLEVSTYYIKAFQAILAPTLILLSAVKFTLVAMFYMHLKFDARLFSWLFVVGLFVAASIGIALIALMNRALLFG